MNIFGFRFIKSINILEEYYALNKNEGEETYKWLDVFKHHEDNIDNSVLQDYIGLDIVINDNMGIGVQISLKKNFF